MASIRHESIFSYSLTRPYPLKWFTPAVIVGAIIATTLFSFLNVATAGYEMVAVETSDPNATLTNGTYYSNWPSYLTANTKPSCDAKTLSVNSAYYTNNTALSYQLEGIWTADGPDERKQFGDMPYFNNRLQNCSIPRMEIIYEGLERSAYQISRQMWGALLKAYVNCAVEIDQGTMIINMTTTYDLNSDAGTASFPGRDTKNKASLWWGESLLAWYYIKITHDIYMATRERYESNKTATYKGYIEFFPPDKTPSPENYTSPDYWQTRRPNCFFIPWSDKGIESEVLYCREDHMEYPSIWPSAESITKSLYSTIMTDLGQPAPNIITDSDLLKNFTANFTSIAALQAGGDDTWGWGNNLKQNPSFPDLAAGPYTSENASSWNLGGAPSIMSATYLCQVPRLKNTSSLFFSVLIADLVLLQALWTAVVSVTDFFVARKYPDIMSCQSCQQRKMVEGDGFEALRKREVEDGGYRKSGRMLEDEE